MPEHRYDFMELPALPPLMSRRGSAAGRLLGKLILQMLGWKVSGAFPDIPKFLIVAAPHTSNWDAIIGLATVLRLNLDIHFYVKDKAFRLPLGWILRTLGGIPVNRDAAHGLVGEAISAFDERDTFVLGITPEGTRKRMDRWKTGFHHIGRGANVPVVLVALDFGRKTIGPIATVDLTDDENHDLAVIAGHFEGIQGRNPELFTPPV